MSLTPEETATHDSTIDEIKALLAEAENVIAAGGERASDEISSLRDRLRTALDRGRVGAEKAAQMAKERAMQADEAIHSHPYVAVGVAAGVGLLLGALLTRNHSRC